MVSEAHENETVTALNRARTLDAATHNPSYEVDIGVYGAPATASLVTIVGVVLSGATVTTCPHSGEWLALRVGLRPSTVSLSLLPATGRGVDSGFFVRQPAMSLGASLR